MKQQALVHLYPMVLVGALCLLAVPVSGTFAHSVYSDIITDEQGSRADQAGGSPEGSPEGTSVSEGAVPLSFLMRSNRRSPSDIAAASAIAQRFGCRITATGAASLSCRLTESDFRRLFGRAPRSLATEPPGGSDAGRPGGYAEEEQPLSVPPELATYVESISVIPPARRL